MNLNLEQSAERCGVSIFTLRREIEDGRLPAIRIRGRIVVDEKDLEQYLVESKSQRPPVRQA